MTRSTAIPRPQTTPSRPASVDFIAPTTHHIKTFVILLAAAAAMAVLLSLLPAAGHDQLWFLLMGQRWLHGAVLYGPSLFDSNPPLIVWISAVPVALSNQLHLPSSAIGKLLVVFAEALSATLSLHLLRRLGALTRTQTLWLAFAFIVLFAVAPARDFGQRDHLTAILCLPYILAAALDDTRLPSALGKPGAPLPVTPPPSLPSSISAPSSRRQTLALHVLAGILAAVGICLKPHQALIPIAVELTLLFTRRSAGNRLRSLLRPEPPILLLSGAAFLLLIRRFTPAYFTLALPTLHDTYWAVGHLTPLELLREAPQLHLLAALALTLFFISRQPANLSPAPLSRETAKTPSPFRPATTLLLAAALAATLAYYLQGTGWYYQQLPAISLFGAALALELLAPPVRLPDSPWLPRAAAALGVLALALTTHFSGYPFTLDRSFNLTTPDPTFFDHLPSGTPVAIITTSVEDTMMPVARYHLLWAQRTNNVWTLPALLRSEASAGPGSPGRPPRRLIPPGRLAQLELQQHAWMLEDLDRWHPQLILIARCQAPEVHCQTLEDRHDNLLAWFERDPAFRTLWQRYHYLRTSGSYDAYIRNGPA